MNIQFRIFDDELTQTCIDIQPHKVYKVGNSIEHSDIYLSELTLKTQNVKYFEFVVDSRSVTFYNSTDEISFIDFIENNNSIVTLKTKYETPCVFEYQGIKIVFCDETDSEEKWLSILNNKEIEVGEIPIENTELSESEISQLDTIYQPKVKQSAKTKFQNVLQIIKTYMENNKYLKNIKFENIGKNKKLFLMSCIGTFLLIFAIIIFSVIEKYSVQNVLQNKNQLVIEDIQNIKKIEVNLPPRFSGLKYMSNQSDMVVIMGVVKNQEDINYIKKQFIKYKSIVHFKLLTANNAIAKLNEILRTKHDNFLTPKYDEKTNRIFITGLLQNLDDINDIELTTSIHLPELSDVDTSQIYSIANFEKDLDELVHNSSIGNRLTFTKDFNKKIVTINGYLNKNEISTINNNIQELENKYQHLVFINSEIKDALSSLSFKIVAVNTNGFPSFMTSDGQKVFEGGEIDGMKVDKITSSQIIFSGKYALTVNLEDALGFGSASSN